MVIQDDAGDQLWQGGLPVWQPCLVRGDRFWGTISGMTESPLLYFSDQKLAQKFLSLLKNLTSEWLIIINDM